MQNTDKEQTVGEVKYLDVQLKLFKANVVCSYQALEDPSHIHFKAPYIQMVDQGQCLFSVGPSSLISKASLTWSWGQVIDIYSTQKIKRQTTHGKKIEIFDFAEPLCSEFFFFLIHFHFRPRNTIRRP